MLKVPQQQYIKYLREVENCNIREIADKLDVSWRTAKKYADQDDWNQPLQARQSTYPVLGPFVEIVDTWLTEDERLPHKQRHTARRIFHRLRDEHDFPGGERTVSAYVSNRKAELKMELTESYQRLLIRVVKRKRTLGQCTLSNRVSWCSERFSRFHSRIETQHLLSLSRRRIPSASLKR